MYDEVSARFPILLLIAALLFVAGRALVNALQASREAEVRGPRRERPEQAIVAISVIAIAALLSLTVFIFTPQAEALAASAFFFPSLVGLAGLGGSLAIARGIRAGRMTPMSKGGFDRYDRATQPKRFWAATAWNSFWALGALVLSVVTLAEARRAPLEDACMPRNGPIDTDKGIAACTALLDARLSDKERVAALNSRAMMRAMDGKLDDADDDVRASSAIDPDNPWTLDLRGFLYGRNGDYANAIASFDKVIAINPHDARAHFFRALSYSGLNQPERAIADLDAVTRLEPRDFTAYDLRADMHARLGHTDAAARDRAEAARLRTLARSPRQLGDRAAPPPPEERPADR